MTVGPTYELLGYKRLIVDYHFSDFVPGTLANANAADYVDACAKAGADSVLVYAKDHWGNCYFATDKHHRHPNVPQDLFGEVLDGLRQRNLVGYAYFSVGWDEHLVRSHPEWAMRTADGAPIRRGAPPKDEVTGRWTYLCLNSPYRDIALDQIEEVTRNYDCPALFLDIIFLNPAGQICACEHCQALWRKEHSEPIPETYTPDYLEFATSYLGSFHRDVNALIAQSGHHILTTHNFGLPFDNDDYIAMEVNPLGRNYLRNSALAKIMRAEARGREVELIGHRFNQNWDFTTKSATQMQWEAATVLAHNCALMWVDQPYMDGRFDETALAAMNASFAVVDELTPLVRGSMPWAEIALLHPMRSVSLDSSEGIDFVGAYKLLTELHWPFDVVSESGLTVEELCAYQLLIVPHAHHMSPEAVKGVIQYIQQGGRLLFTHQTATASLSPVTLLTPSFGLIQIESPVKHPASFVLPDLDFELGSAFLRVTDTVRFQPKVAAAIRAKHVTPNIDVTASRWVSHNVAPGDETDWPAAVSGESGKGRYAYIASRLFAEYVRQDLPAIREFLARLIGEMAEPSVWVEAPSVVETIFSRNGDELIICLINGITRRPVLGGVMGQGEAASYVTLDEVIPIHDICIHVRDMVVRSAHDYQGRPLPILGVDGESGDTDINIERLNQFNAVRLAVDWAEWQAKRDRAAEMPEGEYQC